MPGIYYPRSPFFAIDEENSGKTENGSPCRGKLRACGGVNGLTRAAALIVFQVQGGNCVGAERVKNLFLETIHECFRLNFWSLRRGNGGP